MDLAKHRFVCFRNLVIGAGFISLPLVLYFYPVKHWGLVAVFTLLAVIAEYNPMSISRYFALSAGFAIYFCLFLVDSLAGAVVAQLAADLISANIKRKTALPLQLYNLAQFSLCHLAAGTAYFGLGGGALYTNSLAPLLPAVAYVLTYVGVNNCFILSYTYFRRGENLPADAIRAVAFDFLLNLLLAPVGLLMARMILFYGILPAVSLVVVTAGISYLSKMYVETIAANEDIDLLAKAMVRLNSSMRMQDTFAILLDEISKMVNFTAAVIYRYNEQEKVLQPVYFHNVDQKDKSVNCIQLGEGVIGQVGLALKGEIVNNTFADPRVKRQDVNENFRSLMVIPLALENRLYGVISLGNRYTYSFNEGMLRICTILAGHGAMAIAQATLYENLQKMAITDNTTGLYNHRYFYERLEAEMARARRFGHPLSVILIDLDDFKKYNDTYGHLIGNQVLEQVAQVIARSVRESDIVARYGGEEFAIILPKTDCHAAREIGERVRRAVESADFRLENGQSTRVTLSLGVAELKAHIHDPRELTGRADNALYQAKKTGKNCVCCIS